MSALSIVGLADEVIIDEGNEVTYWKGGSAQRIIEVTENGGVIITETTYDQTRVYFAPSKVLRIVLTRKHN